MIWWSLQKIQPNPLIYMRGIQSDDLGVIAKEATKSSNLHERYKIRWSGCHYRRSNQILWYQTTKGTNGIQYVAYTKTQEHSTGPKCLNLLSDDLYLSPLIFMRGIKSNDLVINGHSGRNTNLIFMRGIKSFKKKYPNPLIFKTYDLAVSQEEVPTTFLWEG